MGRQIGECIHFQRTTFSFGVCCIYFPHNVPAYLQHWRKSSVMKLEKIDWWSGFPRSSFELIEFDRPTLVTSHGDIFSASVPWLRLHAFPGVATSDCPTLGWFGHASKVLVIFDMFCKCFVRFVSSWTSWRYSSYLRKQEVTEEEKAERRHGFGGQQALSQAWVVEERRMQKFVPEFLSEDVGRSRVHRSWSMSHD